MRVATTKMGPNDARCIIWALGEFIYFFRVLFILTAYISSNLQNTLLGDDRVGVDDGNGPSDMSCVVWGHKKSKQQGYSI